MPVGKQLPLLADIHVRDCVGELSSAGHGTRMVARLLARTMEQLVFAILFLLSLWCLCAPLIY